MLDSFSSELAVGHRWRAMQNLCKYPFAAHWLFAGDSFKSGMFLGTAVHETAQVAGAGLVYQEYFNDPKALDVATVTKLVRNLSAGEIVAQVMTARDRIGMALFRRYGWRTTSPLFMTKSTRVTAPISWVGSPGTATRSAASC